ncbi:MAG: dihydroorotate dehydrogenase (quinone) [Alistipes sp.]|nr:dihydroorotate dehydrogenase (quinone) [Alistipes sp.]
MRVSLFQNILTLLPPEVAHNLRMRLMRFVGRMPLGRWWMKQLYAPKQKELHTEVLGLSFRNPIGVAAGFDPDGDNLKNLGAMGFGFVELGSVMSRRHPGTPRPRLKRIRFKSSYLDKTGYPSLGLEHALSNVRKRHKHTKQLVIGCNISKITLTHPDDIAKEYLRVFRNMYQYVDFFVINIACSTSTKPFEPRTAEEIHAIIDPLFEFRRGQLDYRPVLLKISPDLTREELDTIIDILIETPLDGIEAVAGSSAMAKEQGCSTGGAVTGAMLIERAIDTVSYIAEKTEHNYPIIGSGGMMRPTDVKRMMEAGASLVALNTGLREHGMRMLKASVDELRNNPVTESTK